MKFFADEGLDYPLVKLLREGGYDVMYATKNFIAAPDDLLLQKLMNKNVFR